MGTFKRKQPRYIPDPNNKKAKSWSEYMANLADLNERTLEKEIQKKLKTGQIK